MQKGVSSLENIVHSVTLDSSLCVGCTTCVKRCPTEAIRVRDKKAVIKKERCTDCGECIRVCPHHAKKAVVDPLDILESFDHTIALPAPTLYGQFKNLHDRNILLTALKKIGFDDVFEVSAAAEVISERTRQAIQSGALKRPVISSACPAVVRIIRVRFPSLLPHLLPYVSPMELSGRWAKRLAVKKTNLPPERIGCIFISPCPAKATSIKTLLGTKTSSVDAVVSIAEVYPQLLTAMKTIKKPEDLARSGSIGVGWAISGGECIGSEDPDYLAADGMEHVIRVLEALEDDKLTDIDFVELNACTSGCVGGVLTVENPFIARARLNQLMGQIVPPLPAEDAPLDQIAWDAEITYEPVMQLDEDITAAMEKLNKIKELEERFNGMDCGSCGAPSCRALAEDIVRGEATEDQCIFLMREKLQNLLAADGESPPDTEHTGEPSRPS